MICLTNKFFWKEYCFLWCWGFPLWFYKIWPVQMFLGGLWVWGLMKKTLTLPFLINSHCSSLTQIPSYVLLYRSGEMSRTGAWTFLWHVFQKGTMFLWNLGLMRTVAFFMSWTEMNLKYIHIKIKFFFLETDISKVLFLI